MPAEWKRCVAALRSKGASDQSAYAICTAQWKRAHGGQPPRHEAKAYGWSSGPIAPYPDWKRSDEDEWLSPDEYWRRWNRSIAQEQQANRRLLDETANTLRQTWPTTYSASNRVDERGLSVWPHGEPESLSVWRKLFNPRYSKYRRDQQNALDWPAMPPGPLQWDVVDPKDTAWGAALWDWATTGTRVPTIPRGWLPGSPYRRVILTRDENGPWQGSVLNQLPHWDRWRQQHGVPAPPSLHRLQGRVPEWAPDPHPAPKRVTVPLPPPSASLEKRARAAYQDDLASRSRIPDNPPWLVGTDLAGLHRYLDQRRHENSWGAFFDALPASKKCWDERAMKADVPATWSLVPTGVGARFSPKAQVASILKLPPHAIESMTRTQRERLLIDTARATGYPEKLIPQMIADDRRPGWQDRAVAGQDFLTSQQAWDRAALNRFPTHLRRYVPLPAARRHHKRLRDQEYLDNLAEIFQEELVDMRPELLPPPNTERGRRAFRSVHEARSRHPDLWYDYTPSVTGKSVQELVPDEMGILDKTGLWLNRKIPYFAAGADPRKRYILDEGSHWVTPEDKRAEDERWARKLWFEEHLVPEQQYGDKGTGLSGYPIYPFPQTDEVFGNEPDQYAYRRLLNPAFGRFFRGADETGLQQFGSGPLQSDVIDLASDEGWRDALLTSALGGPKKPWEPGSPYRRVILLRDGGAPWRGSVYGQLPHWEAWRMKRGVRPAPRLDRAVKAQRPDVLVPRETMTSREAMRYGRYVGEPLPFGGGFVGEIRRRISLAAQQARRLQIEQDLLNLRRPAGNIYRHLPYNMDNLPRHISLLERVYGRNYHPETHVPARIGESGPNPKHPIFSVYPDLNEPSDFDWARWEAAHEDQLYEHPPKKNTRSRARRPREHPDVRRMREALLGAYEQHYGGRGSAASINTGANAGSFHPEDDPGHWHGNPFVPGSKAWDAIKAQRSVLENVRGVVKHPHPEYQRPVQESQNQGQLGVVFGPLKRPGRNAWDVYNQRRLDQCVECHRSELTREGTPGRETPLGRPGPDRAIVGTRTDARWGTRQEALHYYQQVRQALLHPELRRQNPNWRADVAQLERAMRDLSADFRLPGKPSFQQKEMPSAPTSAEVWARLRQQGAAKAARPQRPQRPRVSDVTARNPFGGQRRVTPFEERLAYDMRADNFAQPSVGDYWGYVAEMPWQALRERLKRLRYRYLPERPVRPWGMPGGDDPRVRAAKATPGGWGIVPTVPRRRPPSPSPAAASAAFMRRQPGRKIPPSTDWSSAFPWARQQLWLLPGKVWPLLDARGRPLDFKAPGFYVGFAGESMWEARTGIGPKAAITYLTEQEAADLMRLYQRDPARAHRAVRNFVPVDRMREKWEDFTYDVIHEAQKPLSQIDRGIQKFKQWVVQPRNRIYNDWELRHGRGAPGDQAAFDRAYVRRILMEQPPPGVRFPGDPPVTAHEIGLHMPLVRGPFALDGIRLGGSNRPVWPEHPSTQHRIETEQGWPKHAPVTPDWWRRVVPQLIPSRPFEPSGPKRRDVTTKALLMGDNPWVRAAKAGEIRLPITRLGIPRHPLTGRMGLDGPPAQRPFVGPIRGDTYPIVRTPYGKMPDTEGWWRNPGTAAYQAKLKERLEEKYIQDRLASLRQLEQVNPGWRRAHSDYFAGLASVEKAWDAIQKAGGGNDELTRFYYYTQPIESLIRSRTGESVGARNKEWDDLLRIRKKQVNRTLPTYYENYRRANFRFPWESGYRFEPDEDFWVQEGRHLQQGLSDAWNRLKQPPTHSILRFGGKAWDEAVKAQAMGKLPPPPASRAYTYVGNDGREHVVRHPPGFDPVLRPQAPGPRERTWIPTPMLRRRNLAALEALPLPLPQDAGWVVPQTDPRDVDGRRLSRPLRPDEQLIPYWRWRVANVARRLEELRVAAARRKAVHGAPAKAILCPPYPRVREGF